MEKVRKSLADGYRSVRGVPFRLSDVEKCRACFAGAAMALIALLVLAL